MNHPLKALLPFVVPVAFLLGSCGPSGDPIPTSVEMIATRTTAQAVRDELQGLNFDGVLEAAYRKLLDRGPELMLSTGLYKTYGYPPPVLTDNSDAYQAETGEIHIMLREALREYDRAALSAEEQVSYDAFEWYLDDRIRGQEFRHYEYPVVHFLTGQQYELIQFFEELHPLETREDVEACV